MNHERLIRDPGFQLNLLLWMAKEQPSSKCVVKPVFYEAGFRLIYVEQPFAFPLDTSVAITASELDISSSPEPELLLGRTDDQKALYIEAKAESFWSNSTTAKQARGHLIATGEVFAEVLKPLDTCLLCYVLPEDRRELMSECLVELSDELNRGGFSCGTHSVHGLAVRNRTLHYTWDDTYMTYVGAFEMSAPLIEQLEEDTDPSPLFLVFSVEDYPDPQNQDLLRRCLVNQIHAQLVCNLNAVAAGSDYSCTAESLLRETTDGVYEYLGRRRKKQMKQLLRNNVFKRIAEFTRTKFDDVVSYEQGNLKVHFSAGDRKTAFLDWFEDFSRTSFSTSKVSERTLPLFSELDDDAEE